MFSQIKLVIISIFIYLCAQITIDMEQNYNEIVNPAIEKMRYCFRKGYMKVSLQDKNTVRAELMQILGITDMTYFSRILNKGVPNISLLKYQAITQAFARRGITDVWTTEEA